MNRFARLSVIVAGALLVTPIQPSSATTTGTITFVGTLTLGGPIGFPVVAGQPDEPPQQHCNLPLPDAVPPGPCHLDHGGNTRGITGLATTTCTDKIENVGKAGKPPANAGNCSLGLAAGKLPEGNHLHGFCGLAGGQFQATFTDSTSNVFAFDIHWDLVKAIKIRGHWRKGGQTGKLEGTGTAESMPTITGVTVGNSCGNSTATTFLVNATLTLA